LACGFLLFPPQAHVVELIPRSKVVTYDQFLAALCIWRESRGQSIQAMNAIWHVIQNRVRDPRFPNSIPGVILQPKQFSSFGLGDPNALQFPSRLRVGDWQAWQNACQVVQTVLEADPTDGAVNFESAQYQRPVWAKQERLTVTIGPFRFYK
jgi:spore germination cell wall hydrolase CwlJ-like protein